MLELWPENPRNMEVFGEISENCKNMDFGGREPNNKISSFLEFLCVLMGVSPAAAKRET